MDIEGFLSVCFVVFYIQDVSSGTDCSGNCFTCLLHGPCLTCNSGWYGPGCRKECPPSCEGGCSKTTGYCLECQDDRYGKFCADTCSPNCVPVAGSRNCLRKDGYCIAGCKGGNSGPTCESLCGRCRDEACVRVSGHCENGCLDGWKEPYCLDPCIKNCIVCDSSVCLKCEGDFKPPYCNTTVMEARYRSDVNFNNSIVTTDDGIDTSEEAGSFGFIALGVMLAIIALLIIGCVVVYTDLNIFCIRFCQRRKHHKIQHVPRNAYFVQDAFGSPQLTRSHGALHDTSKSRNP